MPTTVAMSISPLMIRLQTNITTSHLPKLAFLSGQVLFSENFMPGTLRFFLGVTCAAFIINTPVLKRIQLGL